MVADSLAGLYILAALFQHGIGLIPNFFRYDCGDNFSCFILEHDPFLRWEELLLFGEHIHDLDLVPHIVAFVLGICDHVRHGGVGDFVAIVIAVALIPEDRFKLLHGIFAGSVTLKEFADHWRFGFVDDQSSVSFCVSEDAAVAKHHVGFDCLLMTELHAARELAQLVLCDGGHD